MDALISPAELDIIKRWFFVLVLCMARLAPLFLFVPYLGGRLLPLIVRNTVMLCLAIFLFPMIEAGAPHPFALNWHIVFLTIKEVLLGMVLAFELGIFFWAAEGAGKILDQQREIESAGKQDPMTGESSSPLGNALLHMAVFYFIVGGGLFLFLDLLFKSYATWPVFSFMPDFSREAFGGFMASQLQVLMTTLVLLAAPLSIACFFSDFGLGLVARVAQQLKVFSVSMPVKSLIVSFLMVLYIGGLFMHLVQQGALKPDILNILDAVLR